MNKRTEKKKVILTLCRVFPATHSQAGKLTGFEGKLKSGEKIHTIRHNAKDVWQERYKGIEQGRKYLSVREWMGRPYNSEQREFARYDRIGLQHIRMVRVSSGEIPQVWVDGKSVPIEEVARHDGLNLEDFIEWFFGGDKADTFDGVVIHFTNFRY